MLEKAVKMAGLNSSIRVSTPQRRENPRSMDSTGCFDLALDSFSNAIVIEEEP